MMNKACKLILLCFVLYGKAIAFCPVLVMHTHMQCHDFGPKLVI